VLFELGLGERVVGVTSFCKYPPEAERIREVGGYLDPNYEAITALRPDVVVLRKEFGEAEKRLEGAGIRTIVVDHKDIEGIVESFGIIGRECGAVARAGEIAADLRARMELIRGRTEGGATPKVMVCVEREMGSGTISGVIAAGRDGFYDELIRIAGGVCAFRDTGIAFPSVSTEGILNADPDVIIEFVPDLEERNLDEETVRKDWQALEGVSAVRAGRVHVLTEDFMVIPGPRFVRIIEELAGIIHPEMEWE
jgi:iron complex transport system substrate-binding protein